MVCKYKLCMKYVQGIIHRVGDTLKLRRGLGGYI